MVTFLFGGIVGAPRAPNVVVPVKSGERVGRVRWWVIKVW